jgi:hypothetical protein
MAVSAKRELDYVASSLAPDAWNPLMAIGQIAMVLLSWLSVTLELFVRFNFGERYLSWLRLFLGLMIMELTTLVPRMIFAMIPFLGGPTGSFSPLFFRAAICLGIYHQWRIWRRNRQGIAWHSNSFGVSRLSFLPVSDWMLYRFVEPGLCFIAGMLIKFIDPVTGIWVILASVALFVKNQMVFNAQRGRLLDVIDARIESAAMQGALEGRPKQETAGFSVMSVPVAHFFDETAPDIEATVSATLNPAVGAPANIPGDAEPDAIITPAYLTAPEPPDNAGVAVTTAFTAIGMVIPTPDSPEAVFPATILPEVSPETATPEVATSETAPSAPPDPKPPLSKAEALEEILCLLPANPTATMKEIGGWIGRKESTVGDYLKELQQAGRLQRTPQGFVVLGVDVQEADSQEPDPA